MDKRVAENILEFLNRVELKGIDEATALVEAKQVLLDFINEDVVKNKD